jgi:hypothetical protein
MPGLRAWHPCVMRRGWTRTLAAGAVLATATLIGAAPAGALSISVPASKSLGSAPTGTANLSAQLGTITVSTSGLVAPSFTVTVSATVFKTGGGTANETIGKAAVLYWSGPATASSGLLGAPVPGQATVAQAQDLAVTRTAFSATGLLLSISASWNPTVVVHVPAGAVAGTYTGTITHSAA